MSELEIGIVGGGPAGLYFAVLAKLANPRHRVRLRERNRPDDTFGFGVVFSENTMGYLTEQDQASYPAIMAAGRRWDAFTTVHRGERVVTGGIGFLAIERRRLLEVLQGQARDAGVELEFQAETARLDVFDGADLVVIADGVNSLHRDVDPGGFGTRVEPGASRFTWLGAEKDFGSFTFLFARNSDGAFVAHIYPYREDRSTFIVETDAATFERAGIASFSEADTIAYCQQLFAEHLEGARLLSNRSLWQRFRTVHNRRWSSGNRVLIGDAAHTAHFSVGSGTKMAMEDALALSQQLQRLGGVDAALPAFEAERRPRVEHIQRMAASSADWYATFRHYLDWPPRRLAFHMLTRSQFRYDTLKERDPGFIAGLEEEAGRPDLAARAATASGREPARLHLVATAAVSSAGRLHPGEPLAADLRPPPGPAEPGLQLRHAGPRGACRDPRGGIDDPLPEAEGWPLVAASAAPYGPGFPVPAELEAEGMAGVAGDFAGAARAAASAGFGWLELEFAHGCLLDSFLHPETNRRTDAFGGSVEARLRFPLQVLAAVRQAWPADRLLSVQVNADQPFEDLQAVAVALHEAGAGLVTVARGLQSWGAVPPYGRAFTMLVAGKLRHEAGVPAMAAGGITGEDDARTVLLSERADYVRYDRVRRR